MQVFGPLVRQSGHERLDVTKFAVDANHLTTTVTFIGRKKKNMHFFVFFSSHPKQIGTSRNASGSYKNGHTYSEHDEEHDRPYPGAGQLEHHLRVRDEHQARAAFHDVVDRGTLGRGDKTQYAERYHARYDRRERVDNTSQNRVPACATQSFFTTRSLRLFSERGRGGGSNFYF